MKESLTTNGTNGHLPDVAVLSDKGQIVRLDEFGLICAALEVVLGKMERLEVWGSRDARVTNESLIEQLEAFFDSKKGTQGFLRVTEKEDGENNPWLLIVAKEEV